MGGLTRATWQSIAGLLVSVAFAGVVSGCTAGPGPAPIPSIPAGWSWEAVTADGYSIAIPPEWSSVTLGGKDYAALIAELKATDSEFADFLQQALDTGQTISFAAMTTDAALIGDVGYAPNVAVQVTDSRGHDAAYIATDIFVALSKLDSLRGDVEDAAYPLPADPEAHRLRYELASGPDDRSAVSTLFVLTRADKAYAINVSAAGSQVPGLETIIDTLARSFTLVAP